MTEPPNDAISFDFSDQTQVNKKQKKVPLATCSPSPPACLRKKRSEGWGGRKRQKTLARLTQPVTTSRLLTLVGGTLRLLVPDVGMVTCT